MATANQAPTASGGQLNAAPANANTEVGKNHALMAVQPQELESEAPIPFSAPVSLLPVELDVAVPIREFRVRNLLALQPGQLIESQWGNGEDLPLASGDVQLAWSEFEVIETQLAIRITHLA
ncbi:MAG: FliM/FliN family flagellar motor C-terminal domain-containing protein [Terracidiphilus sp.]